MVSIENDSDMSIVETKAKDEKKEAILTLKFLSIFRPFGTTRQSIYFVAFLYPTNT